jgi:transaldolase
VVRQKGTNRMEVLQQLSRLGVSIWLDDLSRSLVRSGRLADLVRDRCVVGVTSNPTIFATALADGQAYDSQVRDLAVRGVAVGEAVRALTCADVRDACDVLRPTYDRTDGLDGRVSLEVDPRLARDADRTLAEAKALAWMVDRPNLMVKIPATERAMSAITAATAAGISINVTLLFSVERYRLVQDAYLTGLEQRRAAGQSLHRVSSVASFFISRVDGVVDPQLDALDPDRHRDAQALRGQAAIANARLAYQAYLQVMGSQRWTRLEDAGARPQRLLWASTGVKDPSYPPARYVTELALRDTVNTMPPATLQAATTATVPGPRDSAGQRDPEAVADGLTALGVDLAQVARQLEDTAVRLFQDSYAQLVDTVTAALSAAGADVQADGTARPAGGGQRPAAPAESG